MQIKPDGENEDLVTKQEGQTAPKQKKPLKHNMLKKKVFKEGEVIPEEFNELRIPPMWEYTADHEKARVIGPENYNGQEANYCDCCGYFVDRKKLPITCDILEFSFLGSGYPLLFYFMKFCIVVLTTAFLISGLYNIITNSQSNNCWDMDGLKEWWNDGAHDSTGLLYHRWWDKLSIEQQKQWWLENIGQEYNNENIYDAPNFENTVLMEGVKIDLKTKSTCYRSFFIKISSANKTQEGGLLLGQAILNLVLILILIAMFQFFHYYQEQINNKADEKIISVSDYSIWVSNIPDNLDIDYDDEIKDIFVKLGYDVKLVNLSFDLREIESIEKAQWQIVKEKKSGYAAKLKTGEWKGEKSEEQVNKDIDDYQQQIQALEDEMASGKSAKFCGHAFVCLGTEQEKNEILEKYGKTINYKSKDKKKKKKKEKLLEFHGAKLKIREGVEANAIFWKNLRFTPKEQFQRQMVSLAITIALIAGGFVAVLFLTKYQLEVAEENASKGTPSAKARAIGFAMTGVIIALNIAISIILKLLSQFNKYYSASAFVVNTASAAAVVQFLNVAFVQFLVAVAFEKNLVGKTGLIYNITLLFFMNAAVPVITQLLFPAYYINRALRWWKTRNKAKSNLTQGEAQKAVEKPEFPIEVIYTQLLMTMYFAFAYANIIPIGLLFTAVQFILLYWVYKYNLLRRCHIIYSQDRKLSIKMTEMLEYSLILLAFGQIFFQEYIQNIDTTFMSETGSNFDACRYSSLGIAILICLLALINAVYPFQDITLKFVKPAEDKELKLTYDEAKKEFDSNYDIENPATANKAIKALLLEREGHRL